MAKSINQRSAENIRIRRYKSCNEKGIWLCKSVKSRTKWIMLEEKGNVALFITAQVIDVVAYHDKREYITWEKCTLRTYLNSDFIKNTFSEEEQAKIMPVKIVNEDNPQYATPGGNDTIDRVFLLSSDEANSYFINNKDRIARPTEYTKEKLSEASLKWVELFGDFKWWLRSPGVSARFITGVLYAGEVSLHGTSCVPYGNSCVGLRPALWLNLDS